MKKIDTWLDIQRFVSGAQSIPLPVEAPEIEVLARTKQAKGRTLIARHKHLV